MVEIIYKTVDSRKLASEIADELRPNYRKVWVHEISLLGKSSYEIIYDDSTKKYFNNEKRILGKRY